MSPPERLLIALGVLAVGALIGLLLRRPSGRLQERLLGLDSPLG